MIRPANLKGVPDYFTSKALQEDTAIAHAGARGVDLICVNPSVFVGPHDHRPSASMAMLTGYIFDPLKLTFQGGANLLHAADVARAHVLLAQHGTPGQRHIVCSRDNWAWKSIHQTIAQAAGVHSPRFAMGKRSSLVGTALMELGAKLTGKPPLGTRSQARLVGSYFWYDGSRVWNLGFEPRGTRATIVDTLGWLLTSSLLTDRQCNRLRPVPEVLAARDAYASAS